MENKSISETLVLLADLKELFGEDPFRISSLRNIARKISKFPERISDKTLPELLTIEGIGKGTAASLMELKETGKLKELESLLEKTPSGIVNMLDIPGIGPKKVLIIWKTLGIETISELRYACNENRLMEAKGFGLKTQNEILKNLDFYEENEGLFLFPKLERIGLEWMGKMEKNQEIIQIEWVGDLRRKMEYSDKIEILISIPGSESQRNSKMQSWFYGNEAISPENPIQLENSKEYPDLSVLHFTSLEGVPIWIYGCSPPHFYSFLFLLTGSPDFLKTLPTIQIPSFIQGNWESEEAIFAHFPSDFIIPELREDWKTIYRDFKGEEFENPGHPFTLNYYPVPRNDLIRFQDLKGALHNHSTYSDGMNSIEEMARACLDMGLSYLGMADHSRTAVYAQGLSIEKVHEQFLEIDVLNKKLSPFKIFKGIESDILNDGSLDYPDEILKEFDYVVASVHSNLKMDKTKAMDRVMKAISNPYTTILGHPTGRLLLGRAGYPLDMEIIIEACIQHNVVIEINANPNRLDIDWRWIHFGLNKGALFSINPDAHKTTGLKDMEFGIGVARKGGLPSDHCLNAFSLEQIENHFKNKRI